MTEMDPNAQPLNPRINFRRRADRLICEMLGFIRGTLADGVVVEDEVRTLHSWVGKNADVAYLYPVRELKARLDLIFDDGRVTDDERKDLAELCEAVLGCSAEDIDTNYATKLPLTNPLPALSFAGRTFLFTGKFVSGTRSKCEQEVAIREGRCVSAFRKNVDVLVIGTLGSRDWIQTCHGRKIEAAVRHRDEGNLIHIVDEPHWLEQMAAVPAMQQRRENLFFP